MVATSKKIGMGIYEACRAKGINLEELAKKTGYSYRDIRRIIEGKLWISPKNLALVADSVGETSKSLIYFEPTEKMLLPDLEYNKKFSDSNNLYKIIDMLDMYIELREACGK